MSLVKFAAIALAAATVSQFSGESFSSRHAVLAQSFGEAPETFPIPGSLPDGTTLKVDGSTSMRFTNTELESRFEEQYANVDVELDASRTDEAFKALLDGDIDLLATGRPLTVEEKAQGVVEVPLEQREKLAIILGPDNSFEGDLTFEQFARIFRGEITNWSELGGPDLAIRFVDRPAYSDTRRALGTYQVFEGKPFETGTTADPVVDDETDTVVKALGNDGIGYSVVSQVLDRDDLRIIPMHQTLPDDPRYPYSQYRAFVYKEGAGPAALAFLGFATTEPGKEILASADAPVPATAPTPGPGAAETPAASPAPAAAPSAGTGAAPGKGGFPFWLLPLLAIPLLGALLWWLLKGGGTAAAPAAAAGVAGAAGAAGVAGAAGAAGAAALTTVQPRLVLTSRDCRNAYAYWEVPQDRLTELKRQGGERMMVRLYDVTGRGKNAPLPAATAQFPCIESNPDLHLPIAVDDRSYCAEVGYLTADNQWLPIAKSDQVRVPVCPKVTTTPDTATPDTATPDTATPDTATPAAPAPVAKPVTPAPVAKPVAPSAIGSAAVLGGVALGGAALAGAAALGSTTGSTTGATTLAGGKAKASAETARMVLTPLNSQDAYAYWEIPQEPLAEVKRQGGKTLVAKLYDVTDRTTKALLPDPVAQIEGTDVDVDTHFSVGPERDYIAEVGYQTASGNWLPLAQSNSVHIPAAEEAAAVPSNFPGAAPGATVLGGAAAVAASAGAAAMGAGVGNADDVNAAAPAQSQIPSQIVLTPQSAQQAHAAWDVPETEKSALKVEGGQAYQLRIHDVTDVDINQQAPNSTLTYDLSESDCDRTVPLPNAQSDYLAEVGYQTESGDWLMLARSTPVKPILGPDEAPSKAPSKSSPPVSPDPADTTDDTSMGAAAMGAAAMGAAAVGAVAATSLPTEANAADTITTTTTTTTTTTEPSNQGSVQTVKVHSRNNAVMFDEGQLNHIEHDIASTHQLVPAVYTLRLRDGVFNYDSDDTHPGEPFVLLWIHGGTVINQKTGVPVSSTWTTLNGYDDTLMLDVREPATLCAFFVDTYPDDNIGEITLSVIKH